MPIFDPHRCHSPKTGHTDRQNSALSSRTEAGLGQRTLSELCARMRYCVGSALNPPTPVDAVAELILYPV